MSTQITTNRAVGHINAYDTTVVTAFDLREAGQLFRALQAKWEAQGRVAYVMGKELHELSPELHAGWRKAQVDWNAAIDNMMATPYPDEDEDDGPVVVTDEAISRWQMEIEF